MSATARNQTSAEVPDPMQVRMLMFGAGNPASVKTPCSRSAMFQEVCALFVVSTIH